MYNIYIYTFNFIQNKEPTYVVLLSKKPPLLPKATGKVIKDRRHFYPAALSL